MKSMPLQSRLSFRICCALLIPLCGLASCSQSEETEAAAFAPTGTVLEFMNWYLEPQADVLWDSAGYIVTEDGEVDLQPTTQEGWDNVRNAATVVAESGNLLMIPGYAVDSDWMEYSRGLITAGIKAREAAQAKDADALFQAGAQLYSVCLACHNRYIVQTQEGGQMSSADVQPRQLITTVLLSIVLAVVVLVLFVLPAEYNIDATGLGAKMGLTGMAGYQVSALSAEEQSFVSDYVEFPLAPFESIEYKYTLGEGQALMFEWQAEGELVFDFHSEEEGTLPEDSVSFSIGRDDSQRGTYVAPYPGVHGWFWENRGAEEVTVKLKTTGFFTESTTYSPSGEFKRDFSVDQRL